MHCQSEHCLCSSLVRQRTAAQTQKLYVISELWTRQSPQSGREEHGFVIWMRYEEQNALPLERGERRAELRRVEPQADDEERHRGPREPMHRGRITRASCGQQKVHLPLSCSWWRRGKEVWIGNGDPSLDAERPFLLRRAARLPSFLPNSHPNPATTAHRNCTDAQHGRE
jgi:hypothetical protein